MALQEVIAVLTAPLYRLAVGVVLGLGLLQHQAVLAVVVHKVVAVKQEHLDRDMLVMMEMDYLMKVAAVVQVLLVVNQMVEME